MAAGDNGLTSDSMGLCSSASHCAHQRAPMDEALYSLPHWGQLELIVIGSWSSIYDSGHSHSNL